MMIQTFDGAEASPGSVSNTLLIEVGRTRLYQISSAARGDPGTNRCLYPSAS